MPNNQRFSVSLDPELAEMVEDYRFKHRIATQTKAIQRLIRMGFQSMGDDQLPDSLKDADLDNQEQELIRIARELDPSRQELLLRIAAAVAAKDAPRIQ